MTVFLPGEFVDIHIEGARVIEADDDGRILMEAPDKSPMDLSTAADGITISHRAPVEWPPQPGDIWKASNGVRWHALGGDTGRVALHDQDGVWRYSPDELLLGRGPLELVYREGWQPAAEPAESDHLDANARQHRERAMKIAATRKILDQLEADPSLPLYAIRMTGGVTRLGEPDETQIAEVERVAAALGVEPKWSGTHYNAELSPIPHLVEYCAYAIVKERPDHQEQPEQPDEVVVSDAG